MAEPLDIAIIGMAGVYAGARDLRAYWQNILDNRYCITAAPEAWSRGVLVPEDTPPNRIYTDQGGWLHDLAEFDPREFGVMPNTVDGREPDHFVALKQARDALRDSGYLDKPFNHERAGIFLGRGNNTNRGGSNLIAHGNEIDQMVDIVAKVRPDFSADELSALREGLRAQLPPFNPEMLPGLIPNVTTGVIANRLDLMGPNCIIDAACASSLVALEQACRELQSGRCDLMLAGGVNSQTAPHTYMIFSQLKALARERIRPFDANGGGTLLGEGCGVMVLKRLSDAERDDDRIYAVIKGIGVSSDGKAKGLLAPRSEGQVVALKRAYESCGLDPRSLGLIEAHATGIPLGDRTEIQSLGTVFGGRDDLPHIALGSVKSQISHAIPASGAASLIKTSLALHHKVLPPMLCDTPSPDLGLERTPFYINNHTRPWVQSSRQPRRAGVNAFGFGGINAHVVLEEHRPATRPVRVPVLHAPEGGELVLLAAADLNGLRHRIQTLVMRLGEGPRPALASVAATAAREGRGAYRLAVQARDLDDLIKKLEQALGKLQGEAPAPFKTRGGLFYGHGAAPGKLCLLFPGEGAQYPDMLADLCVHFPQARAWFDLIEEVAEAGGRRRRAPILFPPPTLLDEAQRKALEDGLFEMDIAAESVFCSSMALFEILNGLGLQVDCMLGHSSGENTALTASGVRQYASRDEIAASVRAINQIYQQLDHDGQIAEGVLLTVGGLRPEARARLMAGAGHDYVVAMDNCPNQVVVFGQADGIAKLRATLAEDSAICAELPFGRAYHTAEFKPVADAYRRYFSELPFGPGNTTLYSACSGAPFPADVDGIRALVGDQWDHPVRFVDTVQRLYDDGVRMFLECGPSGNLSSFASDILRDRDDVTVLACNSRRKGGMAQLQQTLGQLFALGASFDPAALFAHRDIPPLPDRDPASIPRLNLMMPHLEWPASLPVKPLPEATLAAPGAPAATAPTDPRSVALQTHFALMQSFLESQARVMGLAGGGSMAGSADRSPAESAAPVPGRTNYPLLGTPVTVTDPARLTLELTLDLTRQGFLQDHALGGTPSTTDPGLPALSVVPFTFSMELLAEGAHRLLGRDDLQVVALHQSRGSRWLALDHGSLPLRMVLERLDSPDDAPRVRGRLYEVDARALGGGLMVFEAEVALATRYPEAPAPLAWPAGDTHPQQRNPDDQLYLNGMFHGPRLQGVTHLRRWSAQAIEADLVALPTGDYLADVAQPRFSFDAALLDAAGQLAGYWLSEQFGWGVNCFPYQVDTCTLHAPPPTAGSTLVCRMLIGLEGDDRLRCAIDVIDDSGQVVMRVDGWQDRVFNMPAALYDFRQDPATTFLSSPWLRDNPGAAAGMLRRMTAIERNFLDEGGGIWKRVLAHLCLTRNERAQFYHLPERGPRREEWLMGRIVAKDALREWLAQHRQPHLAAADIELSDAAKPVARVPAHPEIDLPAVSISHSHGVAVALLGTGEPACGIDYQHLQRVDVESLVAGGFSDTEQHLLAQYHGDARTRAAVAFWSAKEAAAKSQGLGLDGRPRDWVVTRVGKGRQPDAAWVMHAGTAHRVQLFYPSDSEVLALCHHLQTTDAVTPA